MKLYFEKQLNILTFYGLITGGDSQWKKFFALLLRFLTVDFMMLLLFIQLKDISDMADFTILINLLFGSIVTFVRMKSMIYQAYRIQKLRHELKMELKSYKMNEKFQRRISRMEKILNFVLVFVFTGTLSEATIPIFSYELAFKMYNPFDLNNSLVFWATVAYQQISIFVISRLETSMDALQNSYLAYFSAMQEQLCDELENLPSTQRRTATFDRRDKLIEIFKLQKSLKKMCKEIQEIFNLAYFIRGLGAVLLLCTSVFTLVETDDPSFKYGFLFYSIGMLIQLIVFFYYGNEISLLSNRFSYSLFYSGWHEKDDQKTTLMLMKFSARPIKIMTMKIFQVDLSTYLKICNFAYSMYALLENINNSK